ncbi:hypothetical protein PRVXT_000665 [Proteinivorax tanatarense]|uniref:Uncharacterized protein n=1 Tax=Proteinivorax tanatarense TaxID=1260629 RepID=A0AAU7VN21_9FIRM
MLDLLKTVIDERDDKVKELADKVNNLEKKQGISKLQLIAIIIQMLNNAKGLAPGIKNFIEPIIEHLRNLN